MAKRPTTITTFAQPVQVTLWDILGVAPQEYRRADDWREAALREQTAPAWWRQRAEQRAEGRRALTTEEIEALRWFAIGQAYFGESFQSRERWRAWIACGAESASIAGARLDRKQHAEIRITETRLGFTSGFDYEDRDRGFGEGGFLDPNVDTQGWYVWSSRHDALHAGGHDLYGVMLECVPKAAAEVRQHFLTENFDIAYPPNSTGQRPLLSRAQVAEIKAGPPPAWEEDEVQPAQQVKAYERAVGLTDVDGIPG